MFWSHLLKSQQAHNIKMTSYQRRRDVASTLTRRHVNVVCLLECFGHTLTVKVFWPHLHCYTLRLTISPKVSNRNLDVSSDAKRGFSLKLKATANSGDPDETARYEPSHLDLNYLHRYRDERVNLRVTESKKDESEVIDKAVKI